MMREGRHRRRRGVAIAALTIALGVAAPELAAPAGATIAARAGSRTEVAARTQERLVRPAQRSSAAASTRKAQTQPGAKIRRQRARRRAQRAAAAKKRRILAKNRRAVRKKKTVKRRQTAAQKRKAAQARRVAARKKNAAAAAKKGTRGHSMTLIDWAEVAFFVLLPFLAVAGLLFYTDYQRKPRAPSRQKRKRSLVITPVSRKF